MQQSGPTYRSGKLTVSSAVRKEVDSGDDWETNSEDGEGWADTDGEDSECLVENDEEEGA